MRGAAEREPQADQHTAEPGAETRVIVARALPNREAVLEEMVVAVAARRRCQDVAHHGQPRIPLRRPLDCLGNLALGWVFGDTWRGVRRFLLRFGVSVGVGIGSCVVELRGSVVCDERSLDLVRMQALGLLAVGFDEAGAGDGGLDAEEVYKYTSTHTHTQVSFQKTDNRGKERWMNGCKRAYRKMSRPHPRFGRLHRGVGRSHSLDGLVSIYST